MPIPIDIYDADAKKHNSVINNEQQHEVKVAWVLSPTGYLGFS
jgi:hypothetical protein